MERPIFRPETKRKLGYSALTAAALTLAACGGNFPGSQTLNQEIKHGLAENGRTFSAIVVEGQTPQDSAELTANKGLNVKIGFLGDGPTGLTNVGLIPEGTQINKAVIFDAGHGDLSAAFSCQSVREDLFTPWRSMSLDELKKTTCYIFDFDRFGKPVKK